ncbi:MAG: caspase domain-containing protein, partial [Cyanobium sp.]
VNLSADGRFVVAALGDGTIRWYRTRAEGSAQAGSEALALFVHPDLKHWILWTPEGFYDASPGGAELFGYHLNNGRNQAGTFISSAQLQQQFFRPDLIARRLAGEEATIADAVARLGDVRQVLAAGKPPLVTADPSAGPPLRYLPNGDVEVRFRVVDQGGGVGDLEIRLNGVRIEPRQNLAGGLRPAVIITPPPRRPLQPKKADLTIAYRNTRGVLGQPLRFELEPSTKAQGPITLHMLAVGITAYRDPQLKAGVRFAAADAQALVDTLRRPGILAGAQLGSVVRIPDTEATRERIRQELQAMAQRVKPGDRFVLYLAGHGTAIDGEYYFLTQELENGSADAVRRQALSGSQLRQLLQAIQASGTLLLFDTCSSGTYGSTAQQDLKASVKRFEQLDGRLMLAAAGDRRMALESPYGQRGIFTAVVIEGLLGKADKYGDDRVVRASELLGYVVDTVPQITEREFQVRQEPYQSSEGNFPLTQTGTPAR